MVVLRRVNAERPDTTTWRTWSVIYIDEPPQLAGTSRWKPGGIAEAIHRPFPTRELIPIGDIGLVHSFLWSTGCSWRRLRLLSGVVRVVSIAWFGG